jgi:hypothetical protein
MTRTKDISEDKHVNLPTEDPRDFWLSLVRGCVKP